MDDFIKTGNSATSFQIPWKSLLASNIRSPVPASAYYQGKGISASDDCQQKKEETRTKGQLKKNLSELKSILLVKCVYRI